MLRHIFDRTQQVARLFVDRPCLFVGEGRHPTIQWGDRHACATKKSRRILAKADQQSSLFLCVPRRTFARGLNTQTIQPSLRGTELITPNPEPQATPLSLSRWRSH